MKPLIFSAFFACLLGTACSYAQKKTTDADKKGKLIWSDEFNYQGLPDPAKWGYEEGFIRNHEKQYYTKARLENCYVKGGQLVIESIKESYKGAEYTSASINTLGKQDFKGNIRVEIKAKLPSGKGVWPALWMMGSNVQQVGWPKCVELDIMEFVGHEPATIHGTFHWWNAESASDQHESKGTKTMLGDIHEKFHVYGLERRADSVRLFIDDQYFFSMKAPASAYKDSFQNPLYLLINTALGGEWGGVIDDAIFPQKFYVDYVRVYSLN